MEIRPITSDRPVVLTSAVAAVRPPAEASLPDGKAPAHEGPSPRASTGSVRIRIHRPEPGMNIARVVDERTGEVLSQLPPEQVLNVVADIVESIRRREGH